MDVFLNLWGGEGYLTCASVLAMASMGLFEGVSDETTHEPMNLRYRCLDFTSRSDDDDRWQAMAKAYNRYFPVLFGADESVSGNTNAVAQHDPNVICDYMPQAAGDSLIKQIVTTTNDTLSAEFHGDQRLALGCTDSDINLSISHGIYGKPWVGEAFYSTVDFSKMYPGYLTASDKIIIINCGGYKGGGTAATFIPLESKAANATQASAKRFNVVAGPSTQFNHYIAVKNPEIYNGDFRFVSIFDIPKMERILHDQMKKPGSADEDIHTANMFALKKFYDDNVVHGKRDYSNLNPVYYMSRFIDRIRSDESISDVEATFISLKPELKNVNGAFNYDITSETFQPDNQAHLMHITNLINAVTVKEIMQHSGAYTGHQIFSFCANENMFTAENLFGRDGRMKVYRFVGMGIILTEFLYQYFNNVRLGNGAPIIMKWATTDNRRDYAFDDRPGASGYNFRFAGNIKHELIQFLQTFVLPSLKVLKEVQNTSAEQKAVIFPTTKVGDYNQGAFGVVRRLIDDIEKLDENAPVNMQQTGEEVWRKTEQMLAALFTATPGHQTDYNAEYAALNGSLLTSYMNVIPMRSYRKGIFGGTKQDKKWSADLDNTLAKDSAAYSMILVRSAYDFIAREMHC